MSLFDLVVVQPIFNALLAIYSLVPGGDLGVSVIIFTIIFRWLLYPLTKRQLHQTRIMRKLQPELARIKQEAGGDKQVEGMRMLDLYKQYGVSPFRSILILLIQLPILIALYRVINILAVDNKDIGRYAYDFVKNIPVIGAVIADPSQFNQTLLGLVNLSDMALGKNGWNIPLLLIALLAAWTQYLISKQTMPMNDDAKSLRRIMAEAADGKAVDQSQMNAAVMRKMVTILPILTLSIMIGLPGALALYFTVSNATAYVQQGYLLRQDETEMEALADAAISPEGSRSPQKAKKSTLKGNITRITARDTLRKGR